MPRISSTKLFSTLLVAGLASSALVRVAIAEQVGREQDINNLRLGQRIRVDDGSCPAGAKDISVFAAASAFAWASETIA